MRMRKQNQPCCFYLTQRSLFKLYPKVSNGMTWNISKCGVVGCSLPLLLCGDPVPYVATYSYLGFPHTNRGIDWASHALQVSSRHDSFVSSLSSCWRHPRTRLAVYRCFVRPLLEYGYVPTLQWGLLSPRSAPGKAVLSAYKVSSQRGLAWIFSTKYTSCLDSLAGLPDFISRFQALKFLFTFHLSG
eukprot:Sdes_comp20980_c1_seq4m19291